MQRRNRTQGWRTSGIYVALLACALVLGAHSAKANTFGQAELSQDGAIVSQFQLVNLGSFSSTGSTVAGRVLVGGNASFTGAETVCGSGCTGNTATTNGGTDATNKVNAAGNAFSALTVFGNVTTNNTLTTVGTNGGGSIYSAGATTSGTFKLNNGTASNNVFNTESTGSGTTVTKATTVNTTTSTWTGSATGATVNKSVSAATVFPFANGTSSLAGDFKTPLQNLYAGLANLPGSPNVTTESIPSSAGAFTSGVDYTTTCADTGATCKYGVIQTTLTNLQNAKTAGFTGVTNNSSDQATFVIVTGFGSTNLLPSLTNSANVIYDFVGASSLTVNGAFAGTILAPLAVVTQSSGATISGTAIVQSLTQTAALNAGNAFTGDLTGLTNFGYNARVPEPASAGVLAGGLGLLALARRRRS